MSVNQEGQPSERASIVGAAVERAERRRGFQNRRAMLEVLFRGEMARNEDFGDYFMTWQLVHVLQPAIVEAEMAATVSDRGWSRVRSETPQPARIVPAVLMVAMVGSGARWLRDSATRPTGKPSLDPTGKPSLEEPSRTGDFRGYGYYKVPTQRSLVRLNTDWLVRANACPAVAMSSLLDGVSHGNHDSGDCELDDIAAYTTDSANELQPTTAASPPLTFVNKELRGRQLAGTR